MDRAKLKNYAPQARRDFIRVVTDRASLYGLSAERIETVTKKGDVAIIGGRAYPASVIPKRKALESRIVRNGFTHTMEALAYTWFNRFMAIRFMELHGYFDHGYRVLSNPEPAKAIPEILDHAEHVVLEGLNKDKVIDLKLDGSREGELYQMLLVAQCNALHSAMPFLFERIDDETELALPDNLLHSDSVIRKLVNEIGEEDWKEVEIIGWLYQFYIAEKKDEVIGKVVASEDIPAATQLFTPNWIVKYLVQNTLGRQWLATYPQSSLRLQMQYYIEPVEQTPEVQEQLNAITPTSMNPEEFALLDPAVGSGHILVEAYDLFKAIYQERGYRAKDIPALILQKNLFGLEIDARAAQLAAFALMMKARADDRRIFDSEVKPNILAFENSQGMNAVDITNAFNAPINKEDVPTEYLFEEIEEEKAGLFSKKALAEKGHISQNDIASLLELFENAKTFGSLIQVPQKLAAKLPEIERRLNDVLKNGSLTHALAHVIKPLLYQAQFLARKYDAVVANPPYMGGKYFIGKLKGFVAANYEGAKTDLYSCFIQRNLVFAQPNGFVGMITIPNWMFLSSFEAFRRSLSERQTIDTFIHNGRGVFGSDFGSCSFVLRNRSLPMYLGVFRRLFDKQGSVANNEELERRLLTAASHLASPSDFKKMPGEVIAYWISPNMRRFFADGTPLGRLVTAQKGLAPCDSSRFVRLWWEISASHIGRNIPDCTGAKLSGKRWFPYNKGGEFRRWYGNVQHVVDWEADGERIKAYIVSRYPYLKGNTSFVTQDTSQYFRECIVWTYISSSARSFRMVSGGEIPANATQSAFASVEDLPVVLAYLNTPVVNSILQALSPTLNSNLGEFLAVPFPTNVDGAAIAVKARELVHISKQDWDERETSLDFAGLPMLQQRDDSIEMCFNGWRDGAADLRNNAIELERDINQRFIDAAGLQGEGYADNLFSTCAMQHPEQVATAMAIVSVAIGCMMGRYSLDKPGLIYANSGNVGFDPNMYKTFHADDDGIILLFETDWGIRDDAANRIVEFVGVAWPKEYIEENLKFIADSFGPTSNEQPRDTIRRYLATGFYKHHLSIYKRRPIYWLFSSGKQRAFQCLVYLHRYHEGTLARMRTEHVIPLQGKFASRIEQLASDIQSATATSHRRKLEKERDQRIKQQIELQAFDEKLRHHADLRIKLDLDDGVKINYAKFGDLVAEVKAVTGGIDDE